MDVPTLVSSPKCFKRTEVSSPRGEAAGTHFPYWKYLMTDAQIHGLYQYTHNMKKLKSYS